MPPSKISLLELEKSVKRRNVSIAWLTASLFQTMVTENISFFEQLDTIVAGGDVLPVHSVKELVEAYPHLQVINGYGPTENTTFTCCYRVKEEKLKFYKTIPIGKPIANTTVYILDKAMKMAPIGVYGELYTGGAGLAQGYLNKTTQTAQRFIENPFQEGEKLYKTGDIVRWLPDGNIEFAGRKDDQLKVRGFRTEPGEILHRLNKHESIKDAVVVGREIDGATELVAYVIPKGTNIDEEVLQSYLKEYLPAYMIPSYWKEIEHLPLTPNGKLDRDALPDLLSLPKSDSNTNPVIYAPAGNEIEKVLIGIWKEVLGLEKVGVDDDFFAIGGHSLKAIEATHKINVEISEEIELQDLFTYPTIRELSETILNLDSHKAFGKTMIDLEEESKLTLDFTKVDTLPRYSEIPGNVLLTGATGFVGGYVLKELLETTNASVFCLVRAQNAEEGRKRIVDNLEYFQLYHPEYFHRIIPVCGDLSKPRLGLKHGSYKDLSSNIDYIYHIATYMDHHSAYEKLKPVNVGATQEFLRLSIHGKLKKIIYASTIGVFSALRGQERFENDSIDQEQHQYMHGYSGSKWVGEKLMHKGIENGLPIQVHRLGLVGGDNITGRIPQEQWFTKLLVSCHKLGYYFDFLGTDIAIAPVDFVAKSLVRLSLKGDLGANVFHLLNPIPASFGEFFKDQQKIDKKLEKIAPEKWVEMFSEKEKELKLPFASFINFDGSKRKQDAMISCERTLAVLEKETGLKFPDTGDYFNKYLAAAVEGYYAAESKQSNKDTSEEDYPDVVNE